MTQHGIAAMFAAPDRREKGPGGSQETERRGQVACHLQGKEHVASPRLHRGPSNCNSYLWRFPWPRHRSRRDAPTRLG